MRGTWVVERYTYTFGFQNDSKIGYNGVFELNDMMYDIF